MLIQSREELVEIATVLAEKEGLKVTIEEAGKGALFTAFGAFTGALLAGPVGLAVGGTLSSISAAWYGRGKYRSVVEILRNDLSLEQKQKLADNVAKAISNIKVEDYASLLTLILTTTSVKELVLKELITFVSKELQMQIVSF